MADKQVNLHPKNASSVNLKPNIITENIPDKAITLEKLDQNLQETLKSHTADINTITDEIENLKASVNTGTFDPTSDNPAGQKSIAGAMEKLDQNLQNTISANTSSIATNRADINKNTASIATNRADINKNTASIATNRADINKNTAEIESLKAKASVNTGTFDPTSDNPAGQKSIAGAMEKSSQNLLNWINYYASYINTNREDINKNTAEIKNLKESVNTGTFDPASDNLAGQKSIMDAIIEADLNARFSRVSSGDLSGAFGNLPSYYSGKFHFLRSTAFPWTADINLSYLFAYSTIIEVDYSSYLDSVFEHAGSINMKQCFLSSSVNIINATYSLRKVNNLYGAFNMSWIKTIKLRDYPVSFDISSSTKFEESDLVEILNNLMDLTGKTSQTLTMGATNLAKLTDSEKAIATNKNWTLA